MPICISAASEYVIYNCDEVVSVSEDSIQTYNDKLYICVNSLEYINIDFYYSADDALIMENSNKTLKVFSESSIMILNNNNLLYSSPFIKINSMDYVSLDLISMAFSNNYEIDSNIIKLWISGKNIKTVIGTVSLPTGETAPIGGIKIEIFAGIPTNISPKEVSGSNNITTNDYIYGGGYMGTEKPKASDKTIGINYDYIAQKTVIINEGYSSTDFFLTISQDNLVDVYIGYCISDDIYNEINAVPYYKNADTVFRLKISGVQKRMIGGNIVLPRVSDEDINYTVVAENSDYIFTAKATIKAGEQKSSYLLKVHGGQEYKLYVIFENGKYMRSEYIEKVFVGTTYDISSVNFSAENAKKVTGMLTLPDNFMQEEDIKACVTLQSADSPYYYLYRQEVTFGADGITKFELYDDTDCKNAVVYYSLEKEYNGLYRYGHYNKTGTSSNVMYADIVQFNGDIISIPLLKTKEITAVVKLPNGAIGDNTIYGHVYAVDSFNQNISNNTSCERIYILRSLERLFDSHNYMW